MNEAIAARLRKAQGEYKPGKIHELIGVVERNERIMNYMGNSTRNGTG